jgi:hypothetical protein
MNYAPIARIVIRYGVGLVFGLEAGNLLAGDPDTVLIAAAVIGVVTEWAYAYAKKQGWSI